MYWFLRIITYIPLKIFYRTKVINKELLPKKSEKCILICNHRSNLDPVLLVSALPIKIHFVAKQELFSNWFKRIILKPFHLIPVNRENISIDSMKTILRTIKENKVLGIFPEGKRNKTQEVLLPFKEGVEKFALKTNCPILIAVFPQKIKIFRRNTIILKEIYNCSPESNNLEIIREKMKNTIEEFNQNAK